jgi:hypothetical protein
MEGQFRVELAYEQVMQESLDSVGVPTVRVIDAEVEQGVIGIEALSTVEVQPKVVEHLSSLAPNELPQQLLLKTTNPILYAFKYVHIEPPYKLALSITRHIELDVQAATIDTAQYRTLFTKDGIAVTAASFMMKNVREQFLRIVLPENSEVWSVFVNGNAEKPALSEGKDSEKVLLIKIINSAQGFPVDLVYKTQIPTVGAFGSISGTLPRPKIVATRTRWDVYLPHDVRLGHLRTNLEQVQERVLLGQKVIEAEMNSVVQGQYITNQTTQNAPLNLAVPTSGVRYSFEKLYANQADEDAYFAVPYTARGGRYLLDLLMIGATLLTSFGIYNLATQRGVAIRSSLATTACGAGLLAVGALYLGASITWPLTLSVIMVFVGTGGYFVNRRNRHGSAQVTA